MTKIHVLLRKEEISPDKLAVGYKIAIVLDVLLATTTITSALYDGATEVVPVMNRVEAKRRCQEYKQGHYVLAGEERAQPIEGFVYPSPLILRPFVKKKALILSTTNGTVALKKAARAKKVYASSLLNNPSVASAVKQNQEVDTIVIICAGNSGEVSLEDLYGAGDFIHSLLNDHHSTYELTDAATAALSFYKGCSKAYDVLSSSRVGRLLKRYDALEELVFAAKKGTMNVVPILQGEKIVLDYSTQPF
ncbi:2-phosphosulfolactate phosphatase [Metabacillus iocasae]|uniref:Probable 2-phosphosulfolactate phosphatase n=1 Tax=Priestia iocasae TaxID=2291674 RepID=A0ABS2QW86_9BACI|nr:2-phosphosulfolactate phosphatase [Metabacillus iocasae]MBM7703740.1 2-phosphosulfolactate phosphatase [Metabacillus iocasae]